MSELSALDTNRKQLKFAVDVDRPWLKNELSDMDVKR